MSKSRIYWLLAALVFFFILVASASQYINEPPLKAQPIVNESEENHIDKNTVDKININTADKDELKVLDGIDKKKAKAIIDYRKEHGDFISIEEIMKVDGIGTKTYIKIKDKICV